MAETPETTLHSSLPSGVGLTPLDAAFREDPYPIFSDLRERAPVYLDPDNLNGWVLTHHDDVLRVIRDLEFWADPRKSNPDDPIRAFMPVDGGEPSMLFLDAPEHRRLRNLVSKSFTPRAAEGWRDIVKGTAAELVDSIAKSGAGEFDLIADLAAPLPAIAIARLLGVDPARQADFKEWSEISSEAFFNFVASPEMKAAGMAAQEKLDKVFTEEIEKRRAQPADDLLGKLVRAEEEGDRLSGQELVTMGNLLLVAGNVTTTDLIGNGVRALVLHEGELAKLRARPDLLENAVEEMLRYDPPVQVSGRIAPHDFEIGNKKIRRGESISLILASANRDPDVYPEPDRFDIEREDTHHQSFGGGAHLCLGAHLARLEAQEAIGALIARFPDLRAAERSDVFKQVPGFRGLAEYWVRV
jgi:cytochrome P450